MEVVRDGVIVEDEPLVVAGSSDARLTEQLLAPILGGAPAYTVLLPITGLGAAVFVGSALYTMVTGIGLWGNNIPAAWAFGIINFVYWIGIGHAGTFISAFLLLLEQQWRTSINRFAEAMTLFAVAIAGIFPLLHLGRPWFFYWLIPYPATMEIWPQFRSTLPWDVAAILTYFWISLLFWYMGLLPDLAAMRDRAPELWRRRVYGIFALGWRGSSAHWQRYRLAYGLLGGFAAPLVVSVHSIVSLDFAIAYFPGWHSAMFPPYFVVGAIHSGWGMLLVLLLPTRRALGFQNVITGRHLDILGRMMLLTGSLLGYFYAVEWFNAWYTAEKAEFTTIFTHRLFGPYGWIMWLTFLLNVFVPQLMWSRRLRRNRFVLFGTALCVLVGMWTERFVIVVGSLTHGYLPSSWRLYTPTVWDWTLLASSFSLFLFLFLLFLRFVPPIPVSEVKELAHKMREEARWARD